MQIVYDDVIAQTKKKICNILYITYTKISSIKEISESDGILKEDMCKIKNISRR